MKILGLDVGNVWVGSALSDAAGITCRPLETVRLEELDAFLERVLREERVGMVVVGHPVTVGGGGASDQTREVEKVFEKLKVRFEKIDNRSIEWILWDERFSTQRATAVMRQKRSGEKKGENNKEHSIAAAFILQSYLDSRALHEKV